MNFVKEELSFLSIFAKCADTKRPHNDKFQIKTDPARNVIVFSQISDAATIINEVNKTIDEDINSIYPINQFLALINSLPAGASIDIKNDGIHFNNNKYEFEKYNADDVFISIDETITALAKTTESITVSDFGKTKNSFIGQEPLDYVLVIDGKFLSALSCDTLVCSYHTNNDKSNTFFVPKLAVTLCNDSKKDSVEFKAISLGKNDEKSYAVFLEGTHVIFMNKEYNKDMASLFEEDSKPLYDHPSKIKINKNLLKDALNRIKVFSSKNIYSRVYCSTTNNEFKVESKEQNSGYAVEIVEAEVDEAIKNQNPIFCISQAYLSTVVSYLKGEQVVIHSNVFSPDGVAVKITDELGEDFFILCFVPE